MFVASYREVVTGIDLAACQSQRMVATLPDTMCSFKVEARVGVRDCPSWIYFSFICKVRAFPRTQDTSTHISLATTVSHDRSSLLVRLYFLNFFFLLRYPRAFLSGTSIQ